MNLSPTIFNTLPLEKRAELIYTSGLEVSRIRSRSHFVCLYRINSFYVEFTVNSLTRKVDNIDALHAPWLSPVPLCQWLNTLKDYISCLEAEVSLGPHTDISQNLVAHFRENSYCS